MIAFLDSSVVLRLVFGEAAPLDVRSKIDTAFASRLLTVEVGRVIDRARLAGDIDDVRVEKLHRELRGIFPALELIELTNAVLARAAGPMPTVLGALDAIHLATALELRAELDEPLVLATHDAQLARAARASGLDVVGA